MSDDDFYVADMSDDDFYVAFVSWGLAAFILPMITLYTWWMP